MEGIVAQNMANPSAKGHVSPDEIASSMKMSPEMQNAFERVAVAGMHLMFDKKTNPMMLQGLDSMPVAELIGTGAVGIAGILVQQSNGTIPGEVLIPVGIYLISQAADFYNQTGLLEVTNEDLGNAVQIYIFEIIKKVGGDPDKMMNKIADFDSQKLQQAEAQVQTQAPAPVQQGV